MVRLENAGAKGKGGQEAMTFGISEDTDVFCNELGEL
jgi:hypothetical protein